MHRAEQQPRPLSWIPIFRYKRGTVCMATLTCGHARQMPGVPSVVARIGRAACFRCGYVRDIKEIRELPGSCGNPLRNSQYT